MKFFLALAVLALGSVNVSAATVFADWTNINAATDSASGVLDQTPVTLAGVIFGSTLKGDIVGGTTNGTFTGFNQTYFLPPLAMSDAVTFNGHAAGASYGYLITFGFPVQNPILELQSLASTMTFTGVTPVRLSGETSFTVVGNTVRGVANDVPSGHDSSGTVQFLGTYSQLEFSVMDTFASGDGIQIQVGATVPEPSCAALLLVGAAGAVCRRSARGR